MTNPERPEHRETPKEAGAGDPVFVRAGESDCWTDHEIRNQGKSEPSEGNRRRRPFGFFRLVRRLIVLSVFLVILLVVGILGSVYVARHWLRGELERRLLVELAQQNIHLNYESASYHFTRGLVLHDVKLFETKRREIPLLSCSEVGFSLDVVDLAKQDFHGDISTAFTANDAELICYENGGEVATIRNLNAEIQGSRESVSVERFRGKIGDLDFDFEGQVLLSREQRRHRNEENGEDSKRKPGTRKVADFAFFRDLMPWLAVTSGEEGVRPELRGSFVVDPKSENPVTVHGKFSGRNFTWRKIPLDSAAVEFSFAEGDERLVLPDFTINYEGGLISGEAVWDSGTGLVDITRFQSSADLLGLLRRINPSLAPFAAMIQQEEPPIVKADGMLNLKHFWASELNLDYRNSLGMTLLLNRGPLALEGIHGRFQVANGGLKTDSLKLLALGGRFDASGVITLAEPPLNYDGKLEVRGLPLQQIVDYFGGEQELPGLLSLSFAGKGGVAMAALNGSGQVRIDGAKFYKVPVIGPIQGLMGSVIPVFGDDKRGEMSATFAINDGVLESQDLAILSDGTRVELKGNLDLSNWQTDFQAEGKLVGALGLVTGLLSKALIVEGRGRVDELEIDLKNVPAEFASETVKGVFGIAGKGVGLVTDTVGTGLEGAQQVAGGALKVTGSVLTSSADAVKNVGQGVASIGQKTVGGGAKLIGDGLRRIIPGKQRGEVDHDDPAVVIGPPDPEELEKEKEEAPKKRAPIFSD
ncbi:MAG: hypothetical protein KDN20_20025 [Verrucomicrobiae bacterium]|nr:hypothetical protein [Verrucomicrobiae bacterium]